MISNNKLIKNFFILLLLFTLLSCSNNEEVKKDNSLSVPKSLLSISTTSKNIIEDLEQLYFKQSEAKIMSDKKDSEQKKEDESQDKSKRKEEIKEKKDKEEWKNLMNKIEQLFKSWNRYESEKNLPQEQTKAIEEKMNQLTPNLENEKLLATLFEVNQLNLEFAKLYRQYYNKNLKAVLEEMRVYMRNIMYLSQSNSQTIAKQTNNLNILQNKISDLKELKIKTENRSKVRELDNYIEDLEELINQENKSVIKLKGNLILNKINEIK